MDVSWLNQTNHLRYSIKTGFLKILQNSQESTCAKVSFLMKLQASGLRPQACNFIKKETLVQVLSWEFCEISKDSFLQNTSGRLLLWLNTASMRNQNRPYKIDVCVVLTLAIYGFTKKSSVTLVYMIFSFVVSNSQEILILFSILLVFNSTVYQHVSPKSLIHATYRGIKWFSAFIIM